jgi:hypothetical protein
MSRVRNEKSEWTQEASNYVEQIEVVIRNMLNLGEDMGFNNEDIFYMITTEVYTQQLLRLV